METGISLMEVEYIPFPGQGDITGARRAQQVDIRRNNQC